MDSAGGLAAATATLARATRFLTANATAGRAPLLRSGAPNGTRVIGNALRELDRFLSVLIDEVAAEARPAGLDLTRLAALRNTPNKLRLLRAALGRPTPGHARLRAIGRGRDCLFHTAGIVRRTDTRTAATLNVGWNDVAHLPGDGVRLTGAELATICRIYDLLAEDLLAMLAPAIAA